MKKAVLMILIMMAGTVLAYNTTGNPGDTPTGTAVTALATQETIDYKDGNATSFTQVVCVTNETKTTTAEYGFSGPGSPADGNIMPGGIVYHYYNVTNEGNANDSNYTLKHSYTNYAGAAGWVVELSEGITFIATLTAGSTYTQSSKTISEDTTHSYNYKVIASSEASGSPNGSYIIITTTAETSSMPVVSVNPYYYTGGNYYTYGGRPSNSDQVMDSVAAPILTLTRTSTTDAPTAFTGSIHDAVPGSVITFTMTYSNTGGASAESVVLVDKIPTNTKLAHANTTGTGSNVTITAAQGNATGWVIKYSTLDSPNKTYGNTGDWTAIGTLTAGTEEFPGGNATYLTGDAPYGAKWIKWEKQYVDPAEDNKTLTWGVTIR